MPKRRGYQTNYSSLQSEAVFNIEGRIRKAETTLSVIKDFSKQDTKELRLLDIGASSGIIDNYLAEYFKEVQGIDIDQSAIEHAKKHYQRENLSFQVADAMHINEPDASFDIIICSHVYEHVPDPTLLMKEIARLLTPTGFCYFSAGNRLNVIEPHYGLPFLSIIPRFMAHLYLRACGRGKYYYEKHLTYWGLKKLVSMFHVTDYTKTIISKPAQFHADYMLKEKHIKTRLARFLCKYAHWLLPGYIWILHKQE